MKRAAYVIVAVFLILTGFYENARSQHFVLDINGNAEEVEGRLGAYGASYEGTFATAVGLRAIHNEDSFYLIDGRFAFTTEHVVQHLSLEIGVRGLYGEVNHNDRDDDITGVAFYASGRYDIPPVNLYFPVNLDLIAEAVGMPEPLSFGDPDSYMEFRVGVGVDLLPENRATIYGGYRSLRVLYEDDTGDDFSSDNLIVGLRFHF